MIGGHDQEMEGYGMKDLWFLMERGIKPDLEKSWTKDLRPLLGVVVPYDAASKKVVDVLSFLQA